MGIDATDWDVPKVEEAESLAVILRVPVHSKLAAQTRMAVILLARWLRGERDVRRMGDLMLRSSVHADAKRDSVKPETAPFHCQPAGLFPRDGRGLAWGHRCGHAQHQAGGQAEWIKNSS